MRLYCTIVPFIHPLPKDRIFFYGVVVVVGCGCLLLLFIFEEQRLAFTVNVPFREFLLCAHTEEDRNQWIAEIKNCITNEIVVTH